MSFYAMALRPLAGLARRLLALPTAPTRIYGGCGRGLLLPPEIATRYLRMVLGDYEHQLQAILVQECGINMVAYDLGAHVSFITLLLARLVSPGGRVHSFEPSVNEASIVEKAVRLNHLEKVVTVHRIAICDEVGEWRFRANSFTGILEKAVENLTVAEIKAPLSVSSMTLDHFVYHLGNPHPDFIKVDVESAEPLVMAGARELLTRKRPTLLVEVHGPTACRETLQTLFDHRYRLTWLQAPRGKANITTVDHMQSSFAQGHWTQHVLAVPR